MQSITHKQYFWGVFHSILCCVIFGLSFLFTKLAIAQNSVITLLGWRFLVAFLVMFLLRKLGFLKMDFKHKDIKKLIRLVFIYPIFYFIGETLGVQYTTSAEAGVIISVIPLVTVLASHIILNIPPLKIEIIGIVISTLGIIISVFASDVSSSANLFGYLMLMLSVVAYSLYAVLVGRANEFSILEKTYMMMIVGAAVFFGAALVEHLLAGSLVLFLTLPFSDHTFLVSLIYLALGSSVIAFFSSNYALEILGANKSVSYIGLSTLVSILAGVIVLHEDFGMLKIIASILIVGGVYIANMRPRPKEIDESEIKA